MCLCALKVMLARAVLPRMRAIRSIPSSASVRSALEIFTCLAVNSTSMVSLRSSSFQHVFRLECFGFFIRCSTALNCALLSPYLECRITRPAFKFEVETGQYMPRISWMRRIRGHAPWKSFPARSRTRSRQTPPADPSFSSPIGSLRSRSILLFRRKPCLPWTGRLRSFSFDCESRWPHSVGAGEDEKNEYCPYALRARPIRRLHRSPMEPQSQPILHRLCRRSSLHHLRPPRANHCPGQAAIGRRCACHRASTGHRPFRQAQAPRRSPCHAQGGRLAVESC